eukprot:g2101.t1
MDGLADHSFGFLKNAMKKGVSTGTTIIAVEFKGGVVIGADSRTSTGTYVANRVSDKLTCVHDRIYCCRSGSAADTQAVSDHVRHFLYQHSLEVDRLPTVKAAANLFKNIVYPNKEALMASIICAGWDPKDGGSVYCLPLGGTCVKQPYCVGGSGSTYIYGLCDATFKKDMTKSECVEFVQKSLSHAMARDGSSGGVIRMVVITKDGVERKFVPGDKLPYMVSYPEESSKIVERLSGEVRSLTVKGTAK